MVNKLFRTALLSPYVYWLYLILFADLGADPAKSFNHKTGRMALYYLVANLSLGVARALKVKLPKYFDFIFRERRWLGVVGFSFLLFHLTFYFAMEGFEAKSLSQLYTKTYLILGSLAWLLLLALALTSNNYSVRKLGGKNWKLLHRFVYLACALVTAHILLIEKADLIFYGSLMSVLWLAQLFRFFRRNAH